MEEELQRMVDKDCNIRTELARVLKIESSKTPSWLEIFFTIGKLTYEREQEEMDIQAGLVGIRNMFGKGPDSNCIPCSDPECKFFSKS